MQQARFSQNSYNCEICLTSIKGARCVSLSCSHVFCRPCLEDFWTLCIKEGDVGRVGCPEPGCVKEGRESTEEEVRRVVTEEDVRRWKWLRRKRITDRGKWSTYNRRPGLIHLAAHRSFCYSLSHVFLPSPRPETSKCGGSVRLGTSSDMSRLWLFVLCLLQAYVVCAPQLTLVGSLLTKLLQGTGLLATVRYLPPSRSFSSTSHYPKVLQSASKSSVGTARRTSPD